MVGVLLAAAVVATGAVRGRAQEPNTAAAATNVPIEVDANQLDYDRSSGWVEARGNVVIRKGDHELRADFVRVNTQTEEAQAFGNVTLTRGDEVWKGSRLNYNFGTGAGFADKVTVDAKPFRLLDSSKAERGTDQVFVLRNATVTTCAFDPPHTHYTVKAREVRVLPGEYMKGKWAVWRFGRVPVMVLPYWYRDLNEDSGFHFYPGHSSRHGAFLLSSYRYRLSPLLRGETHLDYRTRRGVAVGQDVKWRDDAWFGDLSLYYADDQEPVDDDEDAETADIDSERYRIRFRHQAALTDRDSLFFNGQVLSDTDVREDFFEDEYRRLTQPENYAVYIHRGAQYTAGVRFDGRLNDFYTSVNRLPELSLDFVRQQLGDSDIYYEGENSLSNLEKVFPEDDDDEDYSVFRFDTEHTLYRPRKHFGFLTLNPRIGVQGTYYSKTLKTTTVTGTTTYETNLVVDASGETNAVVSTESSTVEETSEGSAEFRTRVELGLEASFKAFKTWGPPTAPRRHVVEPYANYTLVPEPSIDPDDLYQFDAIDALDDVHQVKLGVRNKLQTRRNNSAFDLVDADVYTILNLDPDDDEDALETLYMDTEWRPHDRLAVDLDGEVDLADAELDEFNTQVAMTGRSGWTAGLEHRYSRDDSSLVSGDVTLQPNRAWDLNAFGRYEFEESRFEEYGGYAQRNLDCMVIRAGASFLPGYTRTDGTERDDEWRVILAFWLTAFPEHSVDTGVD